MVADIEDMEMMDASEIYSKRLNAKEVIFPKEMESSFFQSQMDESNLLEEIGTVVQFEEKVDGIFLENQKGLLHHLKTHFRWSDKWFFGPRQ